MAKKILPPRIDLHQGQWYVFFNAGGRSRKQSLRTEDMGVAQERFQGWLKAQTENEIAAINVTVAYACKLYNEQHGAKVASPETLETVCMQLCSFMGERTITDLTPKDMEAYTQARLTGKGFKRKVKNGTVRKELNILRAVFNFMCDRVEPRELRIDEKKLCYIPVPPKGLPRDRVLTEHELETIRVAAQPPAGEGYSRMHRYLHLLIETGARSEALRSLKWEQVDLTVGIIRLNPWGRNQTTKRRPIIPISHDLMPLMLRWKKEATTEFVLDHSGLIRKSMERFCHRMGLEKVTAHTFRHTLATRMAIAGADMKAIAGMLGDSLETVEKNYLHLSPGYLRSGLDMVKRRPVAVNEETSHVRAIAH
jgi:integrase